MTLFYIYLAKESEKSKRLLVYTKAVDPRKQCRSPLHILILTSGIYLVGSIYALSCREVYMSLLCGGTFISSSLYHLYGEQQYFNFDNIFATSLLMIYMWSLYLSIFHHSNALHILSGLIGLPLAVYLLIACGMPGKLEYSKKVYSGRYYYTCMRCQPTIYPTLHSLWHIVSGIGILISIWYFHWLKVVHLDYYICPYMYTGEVTLGSGCYFDEYDLLPVVPCIALILSLLININGNIIGVMPVD